MGYQVFISYRRENGAELALLLRQRLIEKGYSVFIDVEDLRTAQFFNEKLFSVIDECDDMIVVLPPNGLDRCLDDEKDWLRQEIAYALENNKNIIPIMMRDFCFPLVLPDNIDKLRYCQGVSASVEFFDMVIDRICERLISKTDKGGDNPRLKRKFNSKVLLFCIAVCLLLAIGSFAVYNNSKNKKELISQEVGNSTGNLYNKGIVAAKDDIVYYSNISDGNKLYKMNEDGSGKTKLNDDVSKYINIDQEWIYYIDDEDKRIYKIKTDGSGLTKITETYSDCLNVVGEWLYYVSKGEDYQYYICKVKNDGTDDSVIYTPSSTTAADEDTLVMNLHIFDNIVINDWIYYSGIYISKTMANDGTMGIAESGLSRIKTDGTKKQVIQSENCSYCVYGGYIFCDNWEDDRKLYRCDTDGTNLKIICDDKTNYFNVEDDWIYYSNETDGDKLYKIKTDGSGKTKLNDEISTDINLAGDYIYYHSYISVTENGERVGETLNRIKTDGSNKMQFG